MALQNENGGYLISSPRVATEVADMFHWYPEYSSVANNDFDAWWKEQYNLTGTDSANVWRSERTNYLNQLQWQATNAWNLMMWDMENEYNSPQAQKERLLQAGINPIWALSDAPAANASQLTADLPHPNQYAPKTYDLEHIASEQSIAGQTNALNSMLGFGNLDLGYSRLELDKSLAKSSIKRTRAEIRKLNAETESNVLQNKITVETFDTQVQLKHRELEQTEAQIRELESQQNLNDAQKELLQVSKEKESALKLQVEAMTKKIESETFDRIDNLKLRWFEAQSHRIQANASTMSAQAQMQQVAVAQKQYELDVKDAEQRWTSASNAQVIDYINATKGKQHWLLGYHTEDQEYPGIFGSDYAKMTVKGHNPVAEMEALGMVVYKRAKENPSKENLHIVDEYNKALLRFNPREPYFLNSLTPANSSVINPSDSWSH